MQAIDVKARGVTLRRLQRESKEKRDAVEAEVRLEILAEPLQLAIRFIKTGEVAEETMGRAALAGWWARLNDQIKLVHLAGARGSHNTPDMVVPLTSDPIFTEIIATAPPELRPELVGDEVRFKNGSRIVFAACEDRAKAERLRGPKSHKIIVDEAGFIPVLKYVVNSVLLFQLAGTGGKLLMGSSPPDSPAHPFVEFYRSAESAGAAMTGNISSS